jgi:biopolymer transport protein TolQ
MAAQGGAEAILWLLLLLSVVSIGIIIERFLTLRQVTANSRKVKRRIETAMAENSLAELEEIAKDKETIEGRAISYAFRQMKESANAKAMPEIFNSFIVFEKSTLDRYLNFLATVGSNAPFIGLLGTVLGIMKAFSDLGVSSANAAASVMSGIAEALVATAVGLFVAIPAVIAYNYFQRQVRMTLQNLEGLKDLCVAYAKQKGHWNG